MNISHNNEESSAAAQPDEDLQSIEAALRSLNLSPSGHFKDAAARAAVLAAGAQNRGFNVPVGAPSTPANNNNNNSGSNKICRFNRSLHASLRYDKNTAYRIHLMANNTRSLLAAATNTSSNNNQLLTVASSTDTTEQLLQLRRGGSISRNNSSTSSDSGHHRGAQSSTSSLYYRSSSGGAGSSSSSGGGGGGGGSRFAVCRCRSSAPSITSSSSASRVMSMMTGNSDEVASEKSSASSADSLRSGKAATLDSGSCQRGSSNNVHHHPDCFYHSAYQNRPTRPRRASAKLQPSPSSVSSHSNTSSLFRDDGFEDDLTSTASSQYSNQHHRLSFQGATQTTTTTFTIQNQLSHHFHHNHHHRRHYLRRSGEVMLDDDDEYQSCGEEFSNSHTTASTTSNIDDCALSTTSSSIMHHDQQVLDKISLANAKQIYRKSLLLEHQQQQHLLHAQHVGQTNKIQSLLLSSSPKICLLTPNSKCSNTSTTSSASSCISPSKQPKCDDRTVNIIGHMPTRNPGYWDSNLSITQRVVTEIIETERTYVDDLEQIVTGYICYLRNVLKQQKHQQSKSNDAKLQRHATDSNLVVNRSSNEDDDKSMLVFDDDNITSATNDVDDYDVEEADNDLSMKENMNVEDQAATTTTTNRAITTKREICTTDGAIMTANHIKKLFSNLEDIYKFNKDLLFRLEECYLNPSSVAECFVENASGFEVYTHYCTMYPQVVSTLTELMGNQTSAQLLKERQNELNQSLPLGAYLLKPVQRILKYHILFQSLIKHTTDDDSVNEKDRQLINEAFSVMTSIACHINAMKKRHEHAIRVQEVQGLLSGWEGPDLTTLGELILEDTFKLFHRPKSARHLFLFDNVLLITKKKREGSLCYKGHIACSNLMLIEKIEGQPLVFNTVPFDNPKALCAFQAKNLDKKRDWCLQMKEVIIKSFEVKIPVHARDILMSLTSSCTSTYTSSKSSNETARVLRAPNYLEKKRTKQQQDRKK